MLVARRGLSARDVSAAFVECHSATGGVSFSYSCSWREVGVLEQAYVEAIPLQAAGAAGADAAV
jgi:hypothetical protein